MNDSTVLYRQICKAHIQNGRITSLAFKPMPKDNFLLSVYDGDKISAKDSFDHFIKNFNGSSCAVAGVTVADCMALTLPVRPDYETHPFHALIDYSGKGSSQCRRCAEKLCAKAKRFYEAK